MDKEALEEYFSDNHFAIDCRNFIEETNKHKINIINYLNSNVIGKMDEFIHNINEDEYRHAVLVAEQAQTDLLYLLSYITENTEVNIINAVTNL